MRPTVFAYCSPQPAIAGVTEPPTKRAAVCRDVRWERGHLKSISLMGNVLTAIDAAAQGLDEAIMVRARDGVDLVSEGLATNVVLALPGRGGGVDIVTPSLTSVSILAGVTRSILLQECPEIIERPVLASELATAREVMLIGTTTLVTSVVALDGRMIGDGRPGPVARRLLDILFAAIAAGRDDPEQPGGPPTIVHELRQPA
jgi:D-alanine transaminase